MYCPQCGSKFTKVYFTKKYDEYVYRHRKCESCLENFRSMEILEDVYNKLKTVISLGDAAIYCEYLEEIKQSILASLPDEERKKHES